MGAVERYAVSQRVGLLALELAGGVTIVRPDETEVAVLDGARLLVGADWSPASAELMVSLGAGAARIFAV